MTSNQAIRAVTLASAALCAFCADLNAAPSVAYTATGNFTTPPIHGRDQLGLAGQPFSVTILASEALKPTRHTKTSAQYDDVPLSVSVYSGFVPGIPTPILVNANITLQVGATGSPDVMNVDFPLPIPGLLLQLQVTADVTMPSGTITTPTIAPFTAPVAMTITNAKARYAQGAEATTLGLDGSLNAAVQPLPPISVLQSFTGPGGGPVAGLLQGNDGAYYGTTEYGGAAGYGTVFKLSPPTAPGGTWTESVLYAFAGGSDGAFPTSPVVIAADGSILGTTAGGGAYCTLFSSFGCGTVFSLTPPSPPATTWTETVLYSFTGGSDGAQPNGVLMSGGALYGTTAYGQVNPCIFGVGCGTVFELSPPAVSGGAWQFAVLHAFTGQNGDGAEPFAGLTPGPGGTFYGTTTGGGTVNGIVFQLSPPATLGGSWNETVLYDFGASPDGSLPEAPLIVGPRGELYGTTNGGGSTACYRGCGTIFKLTPHGNTWTESILYSFQDMPTDGYYPTAGVLLGEGGTLYGTVQGGPTGAGSIFKLTPPTSPGSAWNLTLLASFNVFDGNVSYGGLTFDSAGALLGTTKTGGTPGCALALIGPSGIPGGCGTIFRLKP